MPTQLDMGKTWVLLLSGVFVPGGPAAMGRVYVFDATGYYIDGLYDPATVIINDEEKHTDAIRLQKIAVNETRLGIPLLVGNDIIHGYRGLKA